MRMRRAMFLNALGLTELKSVACESIGALLHRDCASTRLQARAHDSALLEAKLGEQQSSAALLHAESVLSLRPCRQHSTAQHSTAW